MSHLLSEGLYRARWLMAGSYLTIAAIGLVAGWSLIGIAIIGLQGLIWPTVVALLRPAMPTSNER